MACDVLLLTEVAERVRIPGFRIHSTEGRMASRRRWAAIATNGLIEPLADAHGASALAEIGGIRFCSSILPWRGCGSREPWSGDSTADKTERVVAAVEAVSPTVWGGDWNHALEGREFTGSLRGRRSITEALDRLGLRAATTHAPHRIEGVLSIDHVAVPRDWAVSSVERFVASVGDVRISDHDAYLVDAGPLLVTEAAPELRPSVSVDGRRVRGTWKRAHDAPVCVGGPVHA